MSLTSKLTGQEKKESHKGKGLAMVILKSSSWSTLIGWVSRYEKLFMSGASLKLIVNCLSYLENIIADHE